MTLATTGSSEDQIRALLGERVRAIHDRDAQALTSVCAPDVVSFDALPPLQRRVEFGVPNRRELVVIEPHTLAPTACIERHPVMAARFHRLITFGTIEGHVPAARCALIAIALEQRVA